jgi:hypothetical protein
VAASLALLGAAALLAGCATTQMEAQWRDPQVPPLALQGKTVLVVCRGPDLTLERICEDRLAADAQAAGLKVARAQLPAGTAPTGEDAVRRAASAAGAEIVLVTSLEPAPAELITGSSGSVGVGVGGSSGGYGSRSGAGIGISLPIGGSSGPGIAASTSVTEVANGKLLWSGRARSPRTASEAEQVNEVARVTIGALKSAGLI